jgi:uncharacterized protein YjbI with pentapeptide repeats
MANNHQVEIIKNGGEAWNRWRYENNELELDLANARLRGAKLPHANLRGADLRFSDLRGANLVAADLRGAKLNHARLGYADFSGANLEGADLSEGILTGAKLNGANLSHAILVYTDLRGANLSQANVTLSDLTNVKLNGAVLKKTKLSRSNLNGADITSANLSEAELDGASFNYTHIDNTNLRGADLRNANFNHAYLSKVDFSLSTIGWTMFGNLNLGTVIGLDTVRHLAPSDIGIGTIYRSEGKIPEVFLRGAGVPDNFITYMSALIGEAIEYYSCFLSHSEPDGEFADRIREDLISNNVSCWHYQYDMHGGQFWRVQINEAIKVHEKLVLICSEQSILRRNVVDEIITAMERERETGSQKLFPIRIDDFILSDSMLEIADRKMQVGEWREDWVRHVRAYHIPNFREWKNDNVYQREFYKLLDALKHPADR